MSLTFSAEVLLLVTVSDMSPVGGACVWSRCIRKKGRTLLNHPFFLLGGGCSVRDMFLKPAWYVVSILHKEGTGLATGM